jgi:hypothetical protein
VVKSLGQLSERFVFVGGSAVGLLIIDTARPPVRVTIDVDLITEIASMGKYYELHEELKRLGFREDLEVTCRWRLFGKTIWPRPHRKSGCLWPPLDINRLLSAHAANFSLGLSPALEASRTSISKLNCLNFPRLISDTLACVMPRTLAA